MKSCGGKAISDQIQTRTSGPWVGTFGPWLKENGCLFRLWAKSGAKVELVLEGEASSRTIPMLCQPSGMYETFVEGVNSGARYWFKIDGQGPFPDPASRYQPAGVHGPSEVLGPTEFCWDGDDFKSPPLRELVVYELHVGTFTPAGTFRGVVDKLDDLFQLGINVIELMPIADFAGEYNWGYDGVSLYAPAHSYGLPDELRDLIKEAHRREIAVCLDVVYNHLGPDGAYHSTFAPHFFTARHKTPWGDGLNFDGEGREKVRAYFIESALTWVYDYHIDALRADATDTIQDDSKPHFLTELTDRVHGAARELGRPVYLFAEDARNERKVVLPPDQDGHGFDALWSDDFHHGMRHRLAGDSDGYYRDFTGSAPDIAKTINDGWLFSGQHANHRDRFRGTSPAGLSHESRLFCIQNHDQIGNRAFGERLSTQISRAAVYAASALLLMAPEIPLIFMGQEWATSQPFLFFTNHNEELGRLITEGRRTEFAHFGAFSDEVHRDSIPDPQATETFLQSKLDWNVRKTPDHAACLRWYQILLHMRSKLLKKAQFHWSHALNGKAILLEWESSNGKLAAVVALEGPVLVHGPEWRKMKFTLSSEDQLYTNDPQIVSWNTDTDEMEFKRAGAVLLTSGDLIPDAGSGRE